MTYLILTASFITALWLFWSLFALGMQFYGHYLRGDLDQTDKIMAIPWVVIFLLFDVFFQYTVATVYFLDFPKWGEHLVTKRLQRYIREVPDTWRGRWAKHICKLRLNKFDPSGRHC
jgi:hypothetical protein